MNTDGTGRVNLTNHAAEDDTPSWSPDGEQIAFMSTRTGSLEIHVMDSDGSDVARLTTDPAMDLLPAWSPDGTTIAFLSNRDGTFKWWTMDSDGSNQRLMADIEVYDGANDVPVPLLQGSWHPTSKDWFFAPMVLPSGREVIVIDPTTREKTNLTFKDSLNITACPDGSIVAAVAEASGVNLVRLLHGEEPTVLTNTRDTDIPGSCRMVATTAPSAPAAASAPAPAPAPAEGSEETGVLIVLRGSVVAFSDTNNQSVERISFSLSSNASQTGQVVSLAAAELTVEYSDANQFVSLTNVSDATATELNLAENQISDVSPLASLTKQGWTATWLSGSGPLLDPGERVQITVGIQSLGSRLGVSQEFSIRLTPSLGGSLLITRTIPAELTPVSDLQ